MKKIALIAAVSGVLPLETNAQDSLKSQIIAPVTISAARLDNAAQRIPFAVASLGKNRLQKGQPLLSINESLIAVPGVFTLNPDNFSQDLRISIRGFGARASFGIRGIRLIVDDIPESTPDGQADVDNLDMGAMQQLSVLRGASAGLYGNASGGVIQLQTEEPSGKPFAEAQTTVGSFGFRRFQAKAGVKTGKLSTFFSVGHNRLEGYRQQSAMEQTITNLKLRYELSPTARLSLLANYGNSPVAQDAGGLTREQVTANRTQARPQNVQFNGGESVGQGRLGLIFEKKWSEKHSLKAKTFVTARDFNNRLAFRSGGIVTINRVFGGGGLTYEFKTPFAQDAHFYRTQIGVEVNQQNDERARYDNLDGLQGNQTFKQTEKFGSIGAFWLNEWAFWQRLRVTTGLRYDVVQLAAEDQFLSDGDQSGSRDFSRLNPLIGVNFEITPSVNAYANVASNFESPALNELSANPSNLGGFNPDLQPQTSVNYELGVKTLLGSRLQADISAFYIQLENEFVPYQLAAFPGRTFFRNAANSTRKGVELSLTARLTEGVYASVNYTFSDFRYQNYQVGSSVFDGKMQPGLPQQVAFGELRWLHRSGLFAFGQVRSISRLFADDANTAAEKGYTLVHLRAGYAKSWRGLTFEPYAGINNLLSTLYNGNILINAVGGRYFEPSAGIHYFGGMKIRWDSPK